MDLSQLEIFQAVADSGSVNGAAERLHRVPSNVTTRLKQLEAELGNDLFIREKMRLRLSPAGAGFLDYTRRILALVEEARLSVNGQEPMGVLALGALESIAAVRMPPVLATFHQRHPKVELDLSTGPSGELLDAVIAGRMAGAFVDGPVHHPALEGCAVFEENLVLISALEHPPIRRASEVNGRNIYAFRANCSYRRLFEEWFMRDQATPGRIFEMESYHGMVACVSAGSGLALVPRSLLETLPAQASVQVHDVGGAFCGIPICLVWRRGLQTPALNALVALLSP
ncbi:MULTISPECIES: LysR family transcriptional regulator [unclassified Pseudomonas]|uniref:putrescine utilization regulator PtrR n=1 Tax=unclassified Pseudomonas TaxID=196821 RepID=UPI000BCBE868|nr:MULTISPECIES: LysR family transcriptional regulator [unclassified Pseudomonas]PVZ20629.1 DNA-binding transcriptional LysR family regulator [Pseudomonas sp. URIL14HWK12:I12]PVZ27695.1 DNA-binding transcriptional LysR family regulator [Pseudomonas sp. URIL14HWK12:I10]PVZ38584.1 DNA-binding transcriptional LysR family regulator [Pseudomonas sp. URIL14HWK12:I11]SNZ02774.1 transcriptional regulator, LysR family [Pseudomonas sp. URIL14HWK12:I9]